VAGRSGQAPGLVTGVTWNVSRFRASTTSLRGPPLVLAGRAGEHPRRRANSVWKRPPHRVSYLRPFGQAAAGADRAPARTGASGWPGLCGPQGKEGVGKP
jgi:hypothetical protein